MPRCSASMFCSIFHQLARKFPDIGRVKVDKFGNIIGGVNPFEGTDVKLEDQPRIDDDEEVGATQLLSLMSSGRDSAFHTWSGRGGGYSCSRQAPSALGCAMPKDGKAAMG